MLARGYPEDVLLTGQAKAEDAGIVVEDGLLYQWQRNLLIRIRQRRRWTTLNDVLLAEGNRVTHCPVSF